MVEHSVSVCIRGIGKRSEAEDIAKELQQRIADMRDHKRISPWYASEPYVRRIDNISPRGSKKRLAASKGLARGGHRVKPKR